jgi:hypothetical protein
MLLLLYQKTLEKHSQKSRKDMLPSNVSALPASIYD